MNEEKKKFRLRLLRIPALVLAVVLIIAAVSFISSPKQEKHAKKEHSAAKEPAPVSEEASPAPEVPAPVPEAPAPEVQPEITEAPEPAEAQSTYELGKPDTEPVPDAAPEAQPQDSSASILTIDPDNGLALDQGLTLLGLNSYSGLYIEDTSDDSVYDIMAATILNSGTEAIKYATVELTSVTGEIYCFSLTTLLPGQSVIVLDDYRTPFNFDYAISSTSVYDVVLFDEMPSLHEDVLEIVPQDQYMTVRNISSENFPGGSVYYKTTTNGYLLGGITYLANVPALSPGKEITVRASHCFPDISKMLIVVYSE